MAGLGQSLGTAVPEINNQVNERVSPIDALRKSTAAKLAALSIAISGSAYANEPTDTEKFDTREAPMLIADASGYASSGSSANSMQIASIENKTSSIDIFNSNLIKLAKVGIIPEKTAEEISAEARKISRGNPSLLSDLLNVKNIKVEEYIEPLGTLIEEGLLDAQKVSIKDITGEKITNIDETFRLMWAPKKEDPTYQMFVKDRFKLLTAKGKFRNADGSLDKKAILDDISASENTYERWKMRFGQMESNGQLPKVVDALNNAISYAEKNNIKFVPEQVRKGIAHTVACIAPPEKIANASLYADSCANAKIWLDWAKGSETKHSDVIVFNAEGQKRVLAPFDEKFFKDAYGIEATPTQLAANENFLKPFFKEQLDQVVTKEGLAKSEEDLKVVKDELKVAKEELKVAKDEAENARISAEKSTEEAKFSKMRAEAAIKIHNFAKDINKVSEMFNAFAGNKVYEGKKLSTQDLQIALSELKNKREVLDQQLSEIGKNLPIYKQTIATYQSTLDTLKM